MSTAVIRNVSYAVCVPKGHPERVAYISEFIEEAKASGLMKDMIRHAGLEGVQVPPAMTPSVQ